MQRERRGYFLAPATAITSPADFPVFTEESLKRLNAATELLGQSAEKEEEKYRKALIEWLMKAGQHTEY